MKKLIALILALTVVLSLCACGSETEYDDMVGGGKKHSKNDVEDAPGGADVNDPTGTTPEETIPEATTPEATTPEVLAEPTEQEWEELRAWSEMLYKLTDIKYYFSSVQEAYEMLPEFYTDAVVKYAGTEYMEHNYTLEQVQSKFYVVEDVLLYIEYEKYDTLGNCFEGGVTYFPDYDREGNNLPEEYNYQYRDFMKSKLQKAGVPVMYTEIVTGEMALTKIYNEQGELTALEHHMIDGDIRLRMTPVYDANGRLASYNVLWDTGLEQEVVYIYDDAGQIIAVEKRQDGELKHQYTYTYDEAGRLSSFRYDDYNFWTYTYDDNGNPAVTTYYAASYTETYICECDEQGRVIKTVMRRDSDTYERRVEYMLIYDDYYAFEGLQ